MTAFLSGTVLAAPTLSRRPRRCPCRVPPRVHPARRTPLRIAMEQESPADLSRPASPGEIAAGGGFALRDNALFPFSELAERQPAFEKGGAYAIRDEEGEVCYMGYSKNVAAKLLFHADRVPDKCASFQVYVPAVPPELISPEMLESVLEYWVRENGQVPPGNTVDREAWERQTPIDRKPTDASQNGAPPTAPEADIPVRERTTARRVARRQRQTDAFTGDTFTDSFRSSSASKRRRYQRDRGDGWERAEDDNVEVEVDPLDPFSPSKNKRSTRGSWDFQTEADEVDEDWIPIAALMGCAGLIWLIGFLSNALPAATPSLGM